MADTNVPQESWNMATQTLKRLSGILDRCSFFSERGYLIEWFYASMDLRRNISPFLSEAEMKVITAKFAEMPKGWIIRGKILPRHYPMVHRVLDELYMLFVAHMKSYGLLMPKSVDPRAAIYNM